MCSNPQFPANLVTFTEEILNGKLHFLCSIIKREFKRFFTIWPLQLIWHLKHSQSNLNLLQSFVKLALHFIFTAWKVSGSVVFTGPHFPTFGLKMGWISVFSPNVRSRARHARLAFRGYLVGKLQWHFACGFDFSHSLWLSFVGGFSFVRQ